MDNPSVWQQVQLPEFEPLREDARADVAIVGTGMCGLLTAYRLVERGIASVALLDAGPLAGGVTAHTTAKITSQHGLIYDRLLKGLGREQALLYAQANQGAVEAYAAIVKSEIPDCDFRRCDSCAYVTEREERTRVEREAEAALRLGLPADVVWESELPFAIDSAVRFADQAAFHPLKFISGLVRLLVDKGVRFYPHTKVLHAVDGWPKDALRTAHGLLKAENVVIATHFPLMDKPGLYFARVWQERSYVLALRGVPEIRNLYYGVGDGGYSFRPLPDGLLLGGGNHKSGHEGTRRHYRQLEDVSATWYPERVVTAKWSAQDCMTHDGIPYVGRYRQLEASDAHPAGRVLLATGFNKWGMTGSMAAAGILADEIAGEPNPYAELFSPSRFDPGMKMKKFFIETADMLKNYIGGYFEVPEKELKNVPPGEGRILTVGGERVGVYRDEDGTLHTVKPVCTHLGCILEWNQDEKSWDCPCHGSRYDYTGHILNSPAVRPLEQPDEQADKQADERAGGADKPDQKTPV